MPKLAPPPSRSRAQPTQPVQLQASPRQPTTLGQLSGTGGMPEGGYSGFGGFDPVTGIANGVLTPISTVLIPSTITSIRNSSLRIMRLWLLRIHPRHPLPTRQLPIIGFSTRLHRRLCSSHSISTLISSTSKTPKQPCRCYSNGIPNHRVRNVLSPPFPLPPRTLPRQSP
jgi:hypothetical protein